MMIFWMGLDTKSTTRVVILLTLCQRDLDGLPILASNFPVVDYFFGEKE